MSSRANDVAKTVRVALDPFLSKHLSSYTPEIAESIISRILEAEYGEQITQVSEVSNG
jgi:hypothetical protein